MYVKTFYDPLNRKVGETARLAAGSTPAAEVASLTTSEYDAFGHVTAVTLPAVTLTLAGGTAPITVRPRYEYVYNASGQKIADIANCSLSADGTTVSYYRKDSTGVDQFKASRAITAAASLDLTQVTATRYGYDAVGRETARTLPLGQLEATVYDGYGRIAYVVSFEGTVTQSTSDRNFRVQERWSGLRGL
jgi:YD repeat-containing protein